MPLVMEGREYYLPWEVALKLSCSVQTVRNHIYAGDVRAYRLYIVPNRSRWVYLVPAFEVRRLKRSLTRR